jgi:hypothetical protein
MESGADSCCNFLDDGGNGGGASKATGGRGIVRVMKIVVIPVPFESGVYNEAEVLSV